MVSLRQAHLALRLEIMILGVWHGATKRSQMALGHLLTGLASDSAQPGGNLRQKTKCVMPIVPLPLPTVCATTDALVR